MSAFFGYKVLMVAVLALPVVALATFLLRSLSVETPAYEKHYIAGLELQRQGRFNEAIADYNEEIKLNPAHVKAYSKRGGAHFALGEVAQALRDYNEAIELKSLLLYGLDSQKYSEQERAVAEAYAGRAMVYTVLGKDIAAQQDLSQARDLGYDPTRENAAIADIKGRR